MSLQTTPSTFDIGKMRQRIRIQQNLGVQSGSGAQQIQWVDVPDGRVFAAIDEIGGSELFQAREIYPERSTTITIRYLRSIDSVHADSYRVFWLDPSTRMDRQFDVKSIVADIKHRVMALVCVERPIERPA